MKNKHSYNTSYNATIQWVHISQRYSNVIKWHSLKCNELIFQIELSPNEHSLKYIVEIRFKTNGFPIAYLIKPNMRKMDGEFPKHLYATDKTGRRPLCVYDSEKKEWKSDMLISETFIPWVLTWLNAYEYWMITGKWEYDEAEHHQKRKRSKHQH